MMTTIALKQKESIDRQQYAVEFDMVSKSFFDSQAIVDARLSIVKGTFTVLVGPSGCGKSTLLNLAAGLDTPTEGAVFVGGQRVDGPPEDAALLFQNYNLFPWLTALDNVAFGLENKGLSRKEARKEAERFLGNVGLGSVADKVPAELSGGMQQRVALVRAFALKPSLLLMDEPFAALDFQTRKMMQSYLLATWQNTGATVIMVTHDLSEALYLADRIALISGSPGTVSEIIDIDVPRPRDKDNEIVNSIYKKLEAHLELEAANGEFTEEEMKAMQKFQA